VCGKGWFFLNYTKMNLTEKNWNMKNLILKFPLLFFQREFIPIYREEGEGLYEERGGLFVEKKKRFV
jgi:hypothetical protein